MKLNLKKMLAPLLLAGTMGLAAPAQAVVIYLSGPPIPSAGGWAFYYQGNFSSGEGVKTGSTLVIYDFAGYVPGSIHSPFTDISATAELVSAGLPGNPDFTDDPTLYNLRFTYTGAATLDLSNTGFSGLSARSAFNGISVDGFAAITTKTSGLLTGRNVYSTGAIEVPTAVPEPAMWGMMMCGFGLAGASMRRRRTAPVKVTA